MTKSESMQPQAPKKSFLASNQTLKQLRRDWLLYLMVTPMVIWFLLWAYKPMAGLLVAFRNYEQAKGIFSSSHSGFMWIKDLLVGDSSARFARAVGNTFTISAYSLIFGFPIPIILAILFSEIGNSIYLKVTQTLTYLPHFLSEVTITSIVLTLVYSGPLFSDGLITRMLVDVGLIKQGTQIILQASFFRPLYIITGTWKEAGYSSIVYFAAIISISPHLYEAAKVDGATKLQQIRHVTFPGMAPTLSIMIILRIGNILKVGYERIILLMKPETYEVAETISAYVYNIGLGGESGAQKTELAAAADLFNAVISFLLVIGANFISRQVSETSLF